MIPLKQWLHEEAKRCGITKSAIQSRLTRGKYLGLTLRRKNKRVILVVSK